ncbi:hypothetical protein [Zhenpiania hominis]|uniref:hypothetical protein n=1 Tax=Zhenpiania hominis TaxID=2763644 RepID=UPI0039F61E0B
MTHYLFIISIFQTLFKIAIAAAFVLGLFEGVKFIRKSKEKFLPIVIFIAGLGFLVLNLTFLVADMQSTKLIRGLAVFLIAGLAFVTGICKKMPKMEKALLIVSGCMGIFLAFGYFILPSIGSICFFEF